MVFEMTVSVSAEIGIAVSSALQRHWFIKGMHDTFSGSPSTERVRVPLVVSSAYRLTMAQLISQSLQSLDRVRQLTPEVRVRVLECFVLALRKVFSGFKPNINTIRSLIVSSDEHYFGCYRQLVSVDAR